VRRRGRHVSRLSKAGRHDLRKSLKKLSVDIEALEKILGAANDAAVTDGLAHKLVAADRSAWSKPARALEHWNSLRGRKALIGLKVAMRNLRHQPEFWS
jgi:hypothetical protein